MEHSPNEDSNDDTADRIIKAINGMKKGSDNPFLEYKKHILTQLETHDDAIQEIDERVAERIQRLEERQDRKYDRIRSDLKDLENKLENEVRGLDKEIQQTRHDVTQNSTRMAIIVSIAMIVVAAITTFFWDRLTSEKAENPHRKEDDQKQTAPTELNPKKEEGVKEVVVSPLNSI